MIALIQPSKLCQPPALTCNQAPGGQTPDCRGLGRTGPFPCAPPHPSPLGPSKR